jgi:hypothetical protein
MSNEVPEGHGWGQIVQLLGQVGAVLTVLTLFHSIIRKFSSMMLDSSTHWIRSCPTVCIDFRRGSCLSVLIFRGVY